MPSFGLSLREEIIGVLPPPPGVTPNFINPPSLQHIILITNIILSIVSALFVALRFYTTGCIIHSVGVDDYAVIRYGLGNHLWDVTFSTFNGNFLKFAAICGTFYSLSIMCSKISILVLFLRFLPHKPKMVIYAAIVVVVVYSLIGSFYWLFACQPIEKFWDLSITGGSCIEWTTINIFSGVMNTATDSVILLLPIFMLRKAQLPKWEKVGLILVLMTGGFVLIISIIRLKTTVDLAPNPDLTWEYVHNGIWWMIEMHIAIVCASLPVGRAFLRKHFPCVVNYTFDTFSHDSQND
ncbi:hypothetical protein B0J11DRAFT_447400 [Dendryphion nanum]|uniref:Rhodopsin domain-containing protein n=1 Tax=Dendryphion nanum TaxID=256645 RepID=A0A9P9D392_9PLEO|nr:hypothetical protein B0J11DRAFT_447434 [Dendryphion nanum]KAH7111891.1 hypothetical protein B0J11DRAFT_447400 [Dendryphion nanum]